MQEAFQEMVQNWNRMGSTHDMDEAGDAADRFERSFYAFIEEVKAWVDALEKKPQSLDEALALPEIEAFSEELPGPLLLNFETELELIVEGLSRETDEKVE